MLRWSNWEQLKKLGEKIIVCKQPSMGYFSIYHAGYKTFFKEVNLLIILFIKFSTVCYSDAPKSD